MKNYRIADSKGKINLLTPLDKRSHRVTSFCSMAPKIKKPERLTMKPTDDDMNVIAALKRKLGLDDASIMRLGLRRLAESEGVQLKAS